MSLQSPFGSDVNAQLMALQGRGGGGGGRNPGDMGSREQFMRMMEETRAAEARAYGRQKESEERGFARQMELMGAQGQMQSKLNQDRMALEQQARERLMGQQFEIEQEQDQLEAQIAVATGAKREELRQRHFELKQRNEEMKTSVAESEALASGLTQLSNTQREQLVNGFQIHLDALTAQLDKAVAEGGAIDVTGALRNVVQGARNKARGAFVPFGGIPGVAEYSDLHFAIQDEGFATALAALVPEEILKSWAASAPEGGILGAIGRAGIYDEPGLFQRRAGIADSIEAGRAAASVSGSRSRAVTQMLGGDLASKLGISSDDIGGLIADVDMLRIATQSGDPDRINMVKSRLQDRITDLGGQSGLGQEGFVEFFKAAAKAIQQGPAGEGGVATPRFGDVTSEGSAQDLINALGRGLSDELDSIATTLGSVFGSGQIQRASDYKRVIQAINKAFTPSGPGGEITMDARQLTQLLNSTLGPGADVSRGQFGFAQPDQVKAIREWLGTMADITGQNVITKDREKALVDFWADPANAQGLNLDVLDQMVAEVGSQERARLLEEQAKKRRGRGRTPGPIERPTDYR
jgi:hypothetical protein